MREQWWLYASHQNTWQQGFPLIKVGYFVFKPRLPIFKLDLEIINAFLIIFDKHFDLNSMVTE